MLVAGLADGDGRVCADLWRALAEACTEIHGSYATLTVRQVSGGLDALEGISPT